MARLIAALLRHGEYRQQPDTPSAHQPHPLDDAGTRQAQSGSDLLAEILSRENWALWPGVDSSNMLRAWQTADIVVTRLAARFPEALVIQCFDELAERCVGSAANLSIGQIEKVLAADPRCDPPPAGWKSNSHYRLPLQGAESLMESGHRVAEHITRRMEELRGRVEVDTVKLFFGHGASFRHAAHVLGVLEFEQIADLSMYHATPVCLELLEDGGWRRVAGQWKPRHGSQARD